MLGAQHVGQLGAAEAITGDPGPQQRLALRQQLPADELGGATAAGEIGNIFAELALDLQLERLPSRLGGAELRCRFALLALVQAPLQRHPEADLRYVTARTVAVAADGAGLELDIRIPALVGEL